MKGIACVVGGGCYGDQCGSNKSSVCGKSRGDSTGNIKQLHAIDATFEFNEKGLKANYIFDKRFINDAFKFDDDGRIKKVADGTIQKFYYQNKKKVIDQDYKGDDIKVPVIATPDHLKKDETDTYYISSDDFKKKVKYLPEIDSPS